MAFRGMPAVVLRQVASPDNAPETCMTTYTLIGGERAPLVGSQQLGRSARGEVLDVLLVLRKRAPAAFREAMRRLHRDPRQVQLPTRDEFERRHGATAVDITRVGAFATRFGLRIIEQHAASRTMRLRGTVEQAEAAFGIELHDMQHASGRYRHVVGAVRLPAELKGVVVAVLGLDNRPQARTQFRFRRHLEPLAAHAPAPQSYTPVQVANLYALPDGDGSGVTIALIELGGGYRADDLQAYFTSLGIPMPSLSAVAVGQAQNAPTGDPNGPDGEVVLDVEVAGAIAPRARIVVYFAANTDAGFLDAVNAAIHDRTNQPAVISISWGGPESSWTAQATSAMDDAFQTAAMLGITVCVASGDNGSSDGVAGGGDHVDFPASSPHVLACGGTSLHGNGTTIVAEAVWNDGTQGGASGGGASALFPAPVWQGGLKIARTGGKPQPLIQRGVPDVAANADPQTGYTVRVDGTSFVIGGTSAAAPLWAAVIARLQQGSSRPVGYLNPLLYKSPEALRDVTTGSNGDYVATVGWDACTGLGTPNGPRLATTLRPSRTS